MHTRREIGNYILVRRGSQRVSTLPSTCRPKRRKYISLTPVYAGPIIGIAWTIDLTRQTSWVPETDKILQLVLIIGGAGMYIRSSRCWMLEVDSSA